MPIVRWNETLNIGVGYIDEQHQQLINLMNELHVAVEYQSSAGVIAPLMARLLEYANSHFLAEERLFADIGYHGVADHKQEHQNFIARIKDLSRQFAYSEQFLAIHVKNLLLVWFSTHIKTKDMEYKHLLG